MSRQPLEDILDAYVNHYGGFGPGDRRRKALVRRLGFDGSPPVTLQTAGDLAGITRERMRQIETIILHRTPQRGPWLAPLHAALDLLDRIAPCSCAEAAEQLRSAQLTRGTFHPASVVSAALWFGVDVDLELDMAAERLRPRGFSRVMSTVTSYARRQSGASGVGQLTDLLNELTSRRHGATMEIIRECVTCDDQFVMLGDDWFWHREARPGGNRLANMTRKILAAAERPVPLDVIRDGVARGFAIRTRAANQLRSRPLPLLVAPTDVLRAFYKSHPDFTVDRADKVRSVTPLEQSVELGANERLILAAIARAGGVAETRALMGACLSRRMNRHTFNQMLYGSPIFEPAGPAVWRIRGTAPVAIDPA